MKEEFSHEYYKDVLRVNRLLHSSLLEMRYHCEVYKLSLQCINKILYTNTTDFRALSSLHIIDGKPCLKYSARSNYQRNVALISQKRALDKISVVLKKTKTYIKGYSLLENADIAPLSPIKSVSRPVTEDYSNKEDAQLNSGFLDPEKKDLLQDPPSPGVPVNKDIPLDERGCQNSNEILQDVVPNKSNLSSLKGFYFNRDSGNNEGTLLNHKTSHASIVDSVTTNDTLRGKISLEKSTLWEVSQETRKHISESTSHYGKKNNRSHGEINAENVAIEPSVTCNSPVRVNSSNSRKTRWDNGSQITSGKDRPRLAWQDRSLTKQTTIFKGNNVIMSKRNNLSGQINTRTIAKGLLDTSPLMKVDMNFINFKRHQVPRKYERFASNRNFRDGMHQVKVWTSEVHQRRGHIRNHRPKGHECFTGIPCLSFTGNNLHPMTQSTASLTIPRNTHPSAKKEPQRNPRIDVYPFSHEKIWESLPVSLNQAITQNADNLCGLLQNPPVATEPQGENKVVENIAVINPLVMPIPMVVEPRPITLTHISTFLEDPRLKKRRERDSSESTGVRGDEVT